MAAAQPTYLSLSYPFFSVLTLIFVIAKLTGHFAFSWWIVFTPILVSFGVGALVIVLALVLVLIAALTNK